MTDDLHQTVSEALRASSASTDDCPALFLRVAAGVGRRRRRHRGTAGAVVVVAAGVALALPALAEVGGGHATVSAEAFVDPTCSLPSNAFVRHNEDVTGASCSATDVTAPSPIRWLHTARRYGLSQP